MYKASKLVLLGVATMMTVAACKKDKVEDMNPEEETPQAQLTSELVGTWKASYIYPVNAVCSNQTDDLLKLNADFSGSSEYEEYNSQGSCVASNSNTIGTVTLFEPTQSDINTLNDNIRVIEVFGTDYPDFDDITSLDYGVKLEGKTYYFEKKSDTEYYRYIQQGENNNTRKVVYKKQ